MRSFLRPFPWASALCVAIGGLALNANGQSSGIRSDDFDACQLDTTVWSVVDPVGGAAISVEGVGTSDARLDIAVPGGTSHDLWSDGDYSVRILQPSANVDFEIQARFDSRPTTAYQGQGLLVEQDAGSFLRFDVEYGGGSMFLYSATITPTSVIQRRYQNITGAASTWLDVKRVGNNWTLSYSLDGTTWLTHTTFSYTMTVTKVGVFGSNYSTGSAPAYTVKVDYFLNVASPFPSGEDQVPRSPSTTLTRNVVGSGSITVSPDLTAYYCGPTVTVTAVPATNWTFQGWSGDLSGTVAQQTLAMTTSRTITATFAQAAPQPPVISNITATPTQTTAVIQWQTDQPASSRVDYGLTAAHEIGTQQDPTLVTSHSITLTGLAADTPYHYQVSSTSSDNLTGQSGDLTFRTAAVSTGIFSDDFDTCSLDPRWVLIDPIGGGSVRTFGMGTQDAVLQLFVPGGTAHDQWTDGSNAVRFMQPAPNSDFEVQAKFQSPFTAGTQMEGVLIEQDTNNFLRFDINFDGIRTTLFAATVLNGTAVVRGAPYINSGNPVWLDVQRVGNLWTLRYSLNGTNWTSLPSFTSTFVVNRVGVMAGNYPYPTSLVPAFTANIDYFLNTAFPFTGEDTNLIGAQPGRTLTTSVATGQGNISIDPLAAIYYCNDAVTLTPVPALGWSFHNWSGDNSNSDNPLTVHMDANRNIAANFFRVPFTKIIVDANNPAEPHCKEVGDITGDGLLDIIVASGLDDGVWWYEAPNWNKYAIRTHGYYDDDIHAIDVDGDGDIDVVTPGGVWWYENPGPTGNPRTTVWPQHVIADVGPDNAHDLEVGDMDGDNKVDVVIRPDDGGVSICFKNTPTDWVLVPINTVITGHGTSLADIDGDGDNDIAVNGYWLENPGGPVARTATWTLHTIDLKPAAYMCGVLAVDVNQDGHMDVVIGPGEGPDGPLAWYEAADPRGVWTQHIIDKQVDSLHTFRAGDVDKDGDLDLITAEMHQSTTHRVGVYFNLGNALNWSQEVIATTGSHNIRVADMDKDGDLDIVGANWSNYSPDTGDITLWRNGLIPP